MLEQEVVQQLRDIPIRATLQPILQEFSNIGWLTLIVLEDRRLVDYCDSFGQAEKPNRQVLFFLVRNREVMISLCWA